MKRGFTAGWDEGEALVLAPFSLAVADVEVDVDRSGQPLVPVGGNLDQEAVLQQRQVIAFKHHTKNYQLSQQRHPSLHKYINVSLIRSLLVTKHRWDENGHKSEFITWNLPCVNTVRS